MLISELVFAVLLSVAFTTLLAAVMGSALVLLQRLTGVSVYRSIELKQNAALAIPLGATLVALAFILSASLS